MSRHAQRHPMTAVDVYAYLDYRAFLRDIYAAKKASQRGFSYRSFARRAGVRSPNHLKRVIEGQRNLGSDSIDGYARAVGLEGEDASYFAELVRFSQSENRQNKEASYERIRGYRGYRTAQVIDDRFAEYHEHWFVPAIREMVQRADFRPDARWIAGELFPNIKPAEAQHALDVLFELGMLVRDPSNRISQASPVVSTGAETTAIHVRRYHRAMLAHAATAMDTVAASDRFISALTFCVGPDGFARIRDRVQRFRKELIAVLTDERDGEQVLQLGIQLFPLTYRRGESR